MGIFILEGCDCSGKSTFAEILSKETGFEILKGSSFEISLLGSDGMYLHMMNLLERENIIIDRFFYSNLVYGKLFDYPMMTDEQFDSLVEKMDNKEANLIYLSAPEQVLKYRMESRGDDDIRIADIPNIINEYKEVLAGDFRPSYMIAIDSTDADFEQMAKKVSKFI